MKVLAGAVVLSVVGAVVGGMVGYLLFKTDTNPVLIYFLTPFGVSIGSLVVKPRRADRFATLLLLCASCSLALFVLFPDPRTPLLGKLEYWLVIGLAGFSLLPALLAEGVARLAIRKSHP